MKTRCETCGAIHEVEAKDKEELKSVQCPTCGGAGLGQVSDTYGEVGPRPETIKRYEDTEGGDII